MGKASAFGRDAHVGVEHHLNAAGEADALGGEDHGFGQRLTGNVEGIQFALTRFNALAVGKHTRPVVQLQAAGEVVALGVHQPDP